ncbi:hypothetical protein CONPUDRAFT_150653 [Coniophora puteana RWD-64-598 SS2]|uniref:Carbohydrate-binding module family 5 protein n=1 Tax=Coniophora puteana (strain RWD-64-598) TaxID=741705 RepID=A0A5M3MXW0_CONPW|nr:uncharacterized protein CONPUDRAFT_150653 [Coniophora puteana RWD-64-598 SS2]EIW83565.1 hypothetical protein CONPUDRAFT_150653 [Coniophora puteana RWD-64-598 SS2]
MLFSPATIALALALSSVAQGAALAYLRGDEASYWGSVWQAKEWSYNNPPGNVANQWINVGSCDGINNSNGAGSPDGGQSWNKARGGDNNDTKGTGEDNDSKDNDWNNVNDCDCSDTNSWSKSAQVRTHILLITAS